MTRRRSTPFTRVVFVAVALVLIASVTSIGAAATTIVSSPQAWVAEASSQSAVPLPLSADETRAMLLATMALRDAPGQTAKQAENGYPEAVQLLDLMFSLRTARPFIVGREIMLIGEGKGLKMLVRSDGDIKLVEFKQSAGPDGALLPSASDLRAIAVVNGVADVVRALSPGTLPKATNAYVTGYHVGFASPDGTHLVVYVRADGQTTIERELP